MARTALTALSIPLNTATAETSAALDATNSHVFTPLDRLDKYLLRITNTTASTKAVTIKAGDNPPADAAGQGDLSVSLTAGDSTPTTKLCVLDSARFIQNDGTINIDVAAAMTGTITIFKVA